MTGSIYALNGIAIHDMSRGWQVLRGGTTTKSGFTKNVQKVPMPGRPGYNPAPGWNNEQVLVFVVRTTLAGLEPLLALCQAATILTRTDDVTKLAYCEVASANVSSDAPFDNMQDVTITLNLYQSVWRDTTAQVSGPTSITTPVQVIDMFTGISAPVYDAMIFIRGVFGQFTLQDNGGSYLKTTRAWPGDSSHGLLFVGATGQAFWAAESSPWTPISDMSQYIDTSGNGGFVLTPKFTDPLTRQVELTLTTLTQTSVTARVKAQSAYQMN